MITLVALLALSATACVPLPVPTIAKAPRYTQDHVDAVSGEGQTRDTIREKLGLPDLHRESDRLWVYTWTEDYGAWELVPLYGQWSDNRAGPVESHRFVWFFEFDGDGRLVSQELLRDAKEKRPRTFCLQSGICIHEYITVHDVEYGWRDEFVNDFSAVTVRGPLAGRVTPREASADQCVLLIWPGDEWNAKADASTFDGLPLRIEGVAPWSDWRWLPFGSYARVVLPAGSQAAAARDPRSRPGDPYLRKSTRQFECPAGQVVYVEVGGTAKDGNRFPIALRPIEPAVGEAAIANMARMLPPD